MFLPTYCDLCGFASPRNPCYICLKAEYDDLRVALVEAKSEVTVASCLPKLDADVPSAYELKRWRQGP
jgi:recombinational DNA repair protein RecR